MPSTKMMWVLEELEKLNKENPDDKVIIISSFTSMLDLLENYLNENEIRTCRYQGDMNANERQKSLKVLKKSKKCKVMLRESLCSFVKTAVADLTSFFHLDRSLAQVRRCRFDLDPSEPCHLSRYVCVS